MSPTIWILVLLVPNSPDILMSQHKTEAECLRAGLVLEQNVQRQVDQKVPVGSTFECVETY